MCGLEGVRLIPEVSRRAPVGLLPTIAPTEEAGPAEGRPRGPFSPPAVTSRAAIRPQLCDKQDFAVYSDAMRAAADYLKVDRNPSQLDDERRLRDAWGSVRA